MALVVFFSYVGKLYLNQVTWHIYHENLHPLFFFFLSANCSSLSLVNPQRPTDLNFAILVIK